jgi:hypothetical protein
VIIENPFDHWLYNSSSLTCTWRWVPPMIAKAFTPEKGVESFAIMKATLEKRVEGFAIMKPLAYG